MTSTDVPSAIDRLADRNRGAAELAEALSLATIIEPALARRMRVMLGEYEPGIEADLYFSELVRDRSPGGYTLHPEVAAALRRRLSARPDRLVTAWNLIAARHAEMAPVLQIEERLQWHALNGDMVQVQEMLRDCVAALVDPGRPGFAAWAVDAVERLDPDIRALEEFRMLGIGAALRMGAPEQRIAKLVDKKLQSWLPWLSPPAHQMRKIGVTLIAGGIEFGPAGDRRYDERIEVPVEGPATLSISEGDADVRYISLRKNERRAIRSDATSFQVGNANGRRWRVSSRRTRRFIKEGRAPRVHISYKTEAYGTEQEVVLPFVIGVLADLSGPLGRNRKPIETREFVEFDAEIFDERLAEIGPEVSFAVRSDRDRPIEVDLQFRKMEDFSPGAIAVRVPALASLLRTRNQLRDLVAYCDGKDAAQDLLDRYRHEFGRLATEMLEGGIVGARRLVSRIDAEIRHAFKPQESVRARRIRSSVLRLGREVVADRSLLDQDDFFRAIKLVTDKIDASLSAAMNRILHHPHFQALESAWRGLAFLVRGSETGHDLKIRVLDVGRDDLVEMMKGGGAYAWEAGTLFKLIYEREFGTSGGQPYGVLLCDFAFGGEHDDLDTLEALAHIGATSFTPVIANAAPSLIGLKSWDELANPRDFAKEMDRPDYVRWHAFRQRDASRFLALTVPRILARVPFGSGTAPVEEFAFEEQARKIDEHAWLHASYGLGQRISEAFTQYGWCARIRGVESGGTLQNLPLALFADVEAIGGRGERTTEVAISDRREAELARLGLLPLISRINTDTATFIGVQTVHEAREFSDVQATANAKMSSMLAYTFPMCRFAQYLMCMNRDRVQIDNGRSALERELNDWLMQYVDANPDTSLEEAKARLPLKGASFTITEDSARPGLRHGELSLVANYQLEGMDVAMTAGLRLPDFSSTSTAS